MEVTFYSFAKDVNSTKQPTDGVTLDVKLKAQCSVLAPVLELSTNNISYNYAYIPSFNRYYRVVDWSYMNPLWRVELQVDVLASFKAYIGASLQYVIRSTKGYDLTLPDVMYPAKVDYTNDTATFQGSYWWTDLQTQGTYIVGIIGKGTILDTGESGLVTYYAMDTAAFENFRSMVFDETLSFYIRSGGLGDVTQDIARMLVDIFQYIASCVYVPYTPTGVSCDKIGVGMWEWNKPTGSSVKRVSIFSSYYFQSSIELPKHPQASRGSYMNAQFATYTLSLPGIGVLEIDPYACAQADKLNITLSGDAYSGSGHCVIATTKGTGATQTYIKLHDLPVNIGVPIVLANGERATGDLISGALNVGTALASGNIAGAFSGAVDGAQHIPSQGSNVVGSNGSFSMLKITPFLNVVFQKVVLDMPERFGKPLYKPAYIYELPGYIMCQDAHIEIDSAYSEELSAIEGFMNGGFYYE